MSTNAITKDGELVNIDGTGNRVAALIYGPEHVIVMAGMNKVAANVDEALSRVHGTATPMNCKRLGKIHLVPLPASVPTACPPTVSAIGRHHKTKRHRGTHQSHSDRRGTWILKSRFPPDKAEKILLAGFPRRAWLLATRILLRKKELPRNGNSFAYISCTFFFCCFRFLLAFYAWLP